MMHLFISTFREKMSAYLPTGPNRAEGGITLLLVVLVLSALLSISLGIISAVLTEIRLSGEMRDSFIALYAADRGIEKLYYLDRVADAICNPVDPLTGVFPPCPPYKSGVSLPATFGPLANGSCMRVALSRASNLVTISSVGQYNCASPELSVKRAFVSNYRKDITSNFPTPVGFWKFDEGAGLVANDSSGVDNTGSLANGPTWTTGKSGTALSFDGANDYVSVPGFSSTDGPITVSFWNYVSSADVRASSAFSVGNNGPPANRLQAHVPWSDQNLYWDYGNINGAGRISTSYVSYLNKWTFVALVSAGRNGNFKAIYLDGVLVTSSNSSDGAAKTDLNIGQFLGGSAYEKGKIDEFRIYNVVLTQPQIQTVMNSVSGGSETIFPSSIQVEVWGSGGGGGSNDSGGGAGGGGGGAYSSQTVSVTPGNNYTVTIGAFGVYTPGGDSWFSTTGTVLAKGGGSGQNASASAPGNGAAGGAASSGIGTIKWSGGNGGNGVYPAGPGTGGGGGSAYTNANGGNASGGTGGAGTGYGGTGNGGNGFAPGGGGAGGAGTGRPGMVIISYPTGSMNATGGTITTSGGNTIHTFTSSGTFTVL